MTRGGKKRGGVSFLVASLAVMLELVAASGVGADGRENGPQRRPSAAEMRSQADSQRTLEAAQAAGKMLPRNYPAAVRHIRFAEGPRFADAPRTNKAFESLKKGAQSLGEKMHRDLNEAAQKQLEKWSRPESVPPCLSSKVEKIELGSGLGQPKETLMGDFLFLSTDPPLDFVNRYGEAVVVQPLNQKSHPVVRGFAEAAQITCVPVRLRLTNRALHRFEGDAALKYFEQK